MKKFKAHVLISLRPSVLDPAGEATKAAANNVGVIGITKLRIGKSIDIEIEANSREEAIKSINFLSDRLLANSVIEDWSLDLKSLDIKE